MEITRELFEQQRRPRFGNANPEPIRNDFWEWMIHGEYGPYRACDLFGVTLDRNDGPVWTFDRMGASRNELPDGRVVCVGGEYEDFYDPAFCIYNDVVISRSTEIEIYGYPREIFPPTDFHTATLKDAFLFIIGCVGYPAQRRYGFTPVYKLDLNGYGMSELQTSGEMPGWISEHEAVIQADGVIVVRGGSVFEERNGNQRFRKNFEDYALDTSSMVWRRLTRRNWRQFQVRQEDGKAFVLEHRPEPNALVPSSIKCTIVANTEWDRCSIEVQRVQVSITVSVTHIEVIVEGDLGYELSLELAEEIRAKCEESIHRKCVVELL